VVGDNDDESLRQRTCEGGNEYRVAAAGQATDAQRRTGTRQRAERAGECRKRLDGVEETRETHQ
jgi:hypothetical protein